MRQYSGALTVLYDVLYRFLSRSCFLSYCMVQTLNRVLMENRVSRSTRIFNTGSSHILLETEGPQV